MILFENITSWSCNTQVIQGIIHMIGVKPSFNNSKYHYPCVKYHVIYYSSMLNRIQWTEARFSTRSLINLDSVLLSTLTRLQTLCFIWFPSIVLIRLRLYSDTLKMYNSKLFIQAMYIWPTDMSELSADLTRTDRLLTANIRFNDIWITFNWNIHKITVHKVRLLGN